MLYAVIAAIVLIADQWLKYSVTVNITLAAESQELIPGVLSLVNVHNNGVSFSFLSNFAYTRWVILGIAVLFVVLVIILLIKESFTSKFVIWCAVLAMAGAVGNCIDRVLYGYVVDMIKLEFVNFAVFNVADIVLVMSCLCFIIYMIVDIFSHPAEKEEKPAKEKRSKRKAEKAEEPADENIAAAEIRSDDPLFPEQSAPIMPPEKPVVDDDFWASFTRGTTLPGSDELPKAKVKEEPKPAKPKIEFVNSFELPKSEPAPKAAPAPAPKAKPAPAAAPKPAPAPAPVEEEYDLESILAEFLS